MSDTVATFSKNWNPFVRFSNDWKPKNHKPANNDLFCHFLSEEVLTVRKNRVCCVSCIQRGVWIARQPDNPRCHGLAKRRCAPRGESWVQPHLPPLWTHKILRTAYFVL